MDATNGESSTLASSSKAMDAAVNELSEIITQLEEEPENVPLLRRQIRIMQRLDMPESLEAILRLSSLVMLNEDVWLKYLDDLIESSPKPLTLDLFVEILERFDQAERDYISCAILLRHIDFVLQCSRSNSQGSDDTLSVDTDLASFLTENSTRSIVQGVVQRGEGLMSESHLLWQPWLAWEMTFISSDGQIGRIHAMFIDRMGVPHTAVNDTSSAYSTFCSEYSPEQYETFLVQATEASQSAKTKLYVEKRYGKARADFEEELTFLSYINWETDLRVKNPKNASKAPTSDPILIIAVFERAVAVYARGAAVAGISLTKVEDAIGTAEVVKPAQKGKGKMKANEETVDLPAMQQEKRVANETIQAYKEAESGVWKKYASWMEGNGAQAEEILLRATKACPQSGDPWCSLLYGMELAKRPLEELTSTFRRALATGLLTRPEAPTSALTDLIVCRAAFESRTEPVEAVTGDYHPTMTTISHGMEMVMKMNPSGDPSCRLEKFLLEWAETRAPYLLEQALLLVDKPSKARAASYQMILIRSGVNTRYGKVDEARQSFANAIQRSDLDWPEAVYEAFTQFEHVHGDLATLLSATKMIEKEQEKVTRRRHRIAAEQIEQYQAQPAVQDSAPINVDVPNGTSHDEVQATNSAEAQSKRDREHTTVLVHGLPKDTTAARVEAFFEGSGIIRETTILSGDDIDAALVEFRTIEAVPAALDRNRRKLEGQEVSVTMLWRSTLFVTNFSSNTDDAGLRKLFAQYGAILQIRWPSRKYSDARRFCYITMDAPASAQNALILHGMKTEEGFDMTVAISDPSAKTKRTDFSDSTLFIGGLSSETTEEDVRNLLGPHGTIQRINLSWDKIESICKGFAFVDMASEADAKACLVLHGRKIKGKKLKVEMRDPNYANKKQIDTHSATGARQAAEKRARTVRLLNLPEGTQEGLLQQALEKVVPVKRLEMFTKTREAIAELESEQHAGRLLLRTEPFVFDGLTITFVEQGRRAPAPPLASRSEVQSIPSSSLTFAPRTAKKPGVGKGRRAPALDKAFPLAMTMSSNSTATRNQDDFRAIMNVKNKQRETKLAQARESRSAETGDKRSAEDGIEAGDDHDAKRAKMDDEPIS